MPPESVAFDRAADYYDETRGFPPDQQPPIAALIARAANLTRASRVIEVGIGTGRIALPLAEHVRAITGIDLARPMLNRLRAKRTAEPVHIAQGDITRLPL
ncbi:MAG: class I SAM-dependent methyltransferase, partial [Anaerolineae bacterium]|nr:class I SAM-dependent methyltransferase [Anaerolineae bacterium]